MSKLHKNPAIMKYYLPIIFLFSIFLISACDKENTTDPVVVEPQAASDTYATLKSVIDQNCAGCHSYGGNAFSFGDFSNYSSIEGILANSSQEFINRITSTDPNYRMPPAGSLSSSQIDRLVNWVNDDYPEN